MEEKQSVLGILREAFKITIRNGKLVFLISLFMFIYYYLSEFADRLILLPVLLDFSSKYEINPDFISLSKTDPQLYKSILKDIRFVLVYGLITLALSSLIMLTSLSGLIHSTNEAYTAKVLSFKDMFFSIRANWKRPLNTAFCLLFISFAVLVFFIIIFGLAAVMIDESLPNNPIQNGLLALGGLLCVYLSAIWILSLVVSVLEENSSGMKAVDRARDLMKGKRLQGFLLMLILILASVAISQIFAILAKNVPNSRLVLIAISIPRIWLLCLKKLIVFIVFTIFYNECKRSHHQVLDHKITSLYIPISNVEV